MWQKLFTVYNLNLELTHTKFQDKSSAALKVTASFTLSFTYSSHTRSFKTSLVQH